MTLRRSILPLTALLFLKCAAGGTSFRLPIVIEPTSVPNALGARGPGFEAEIQPARIVYLPKDRRSGYEMRFDGANSGARITLADRLPGVSSYLIGSPDRWRTGVPQYGSAKAEGVYPGVDVEWHGHAGKLEYDFTVQPGGDYRRIHLEFRGPSALRIRPDGALAISTKSGGDVLQRLSVYQMTDRRRVAVEGRFRRIDARHVAFQIGSYDRSRPLIIDPELDFATLLSGSAQDRASGIALDNEKNIYITGTTTSADFPGALSSPGAPAQFDVFVAKMDPTGTRLYYSILIGDSGFLLHAPSGIAVDSTGAAYVAGNTTSTDFPTSSCIGSAQKASPGAYAMKLNSSGTGLSWSTCLAANPNAEVNGITVSPSGNVFVVGTVQGAFPVTAGAAEPVLPAPAPGDSPTAGFAAELNAGGSAYVYATYLGGATGITAANAGALDSPGNLFVTGLTTSADFPVTGAAYQNASHSGSNSSAFVTKISSDGSAFLYSTYLGGRGGDSGAAIAVDAAGSAYVTGSANQGTDAGLSNPFPTTPGVIDTDGSEFKGFLTKLTPDGSGLVYSTYLPQEAAQYGAGGALALNPDGSLFVGQGFARLLSYIAGGGATTVTASGVNVLSINSDATAVLDSQFIGDVNAFAICADGPNVFIAGQTGDNEAVATPGAYQEALKGLFGAFVAKVDFSARDLPTLNIDAQSLIFDQPTADPPAPIAISLTSSGAPIAFHLVDPVLSFSQTDGVTPAQVVVSAISAAPQGPGNPGYLSVFAPGAANGVQEIPVIVNQENPAFELTTPTPGGLLFEVDGPGAAPQQVTASLTAVSDSRFHYGAVTQIAEPFTATSGNSWLTVTPSSGTTPATLTLTANPAGLSNGTYSSEIIVRNKTSAIPANIRASMIVGPHLIILTPSLEANAGGEAVSAPLLLTSSGTPLSFTITPRSVPWLTVSPLTGTTPSSPTLTANPAGLAPGTYSTQLTVTAGGSQSTATVTFTVLTASGAPAMLVGALISSAATSSAATGVAPGSLASIYGDNLTNSTAQAATLPLPSQLGGVSVIIGGYTARLLYVSASQINLQIPSEILPGKASFEVIGPLGTATGTATIVQAQPGMFVNYSAFLSPIIVNPDGSLNDPSHPAHPGDYVVLYMTGQGPLDTPVPDGAAAPSNPPARAVLPVSVTVGGLDAPVSFAGLTPTLTALFQVNVQIPAIYDGIHPLIVTVGSAASDIFPISVSD